MGRKMTQPEYVERIEALGKGFKVLGTYAGSHSLIDHLCPNGHVFDSAPTAVLSGRGCRFCLQKTQPQYVKEVDSVGTGFTVVGTYVGAFTPIAHRCSEGHEFPASPNNILQGMGCRYCKIITPEEYEKRLKEDGRGFVALEPYDGSTKKIKHRCSKGHEFLKTPNAIQKGDGCRDCRVITPEEYDKWLREDGRGFVALEPYGGDAVPITHRCLCGREWKITPSNIKQGQGCSGCSTKTTDGNVFYIWQNGDSDIYKVGITSERCAEDRIKICTKKNGMTANMVLKINTPNARDIEREALAMGTVTDYPSTIDGYTEFRYFTEAQLTDVCQMANQMSQGS